MLPWADTVARRFPPIVVWTLIGVNLLAFLYQVGLPPRALDRFLFDFALVPSRFFGRLSLVAPSDPTPFVTNMFLHGGWLHLIVNMWTLWIFGPAVEDRLGPGRFVLFYLFCGVAAGLAHALANPESVVPALGASGAIAGVIGCYARMFPAARLVVIVPILFIPLFFEIRAIVFAAIWFATQVIPGLLSIGDQATGGVAWWAHIGGFVAGWLVTPLLKRPASAYRHHYRDEGVYGFLPDGRREGGIGPWT
ncbi:membrane associated rhomboid family serine protease [Tepidamorphus gemmatus]|uniref:Membrane associated rhomboid family serine protease n=1 Tax=Tepidamorphus gemmatus TaxID=747076 RepID=A0A4R3MF69_9HYPH|nr:rhomboid family intramembrane serine protease [Tepidamorphus gemmatus]TCT12479.1 membrane associated rhomboid family serine protease [Tepidamorphus gemmatus]